MATARDTAGTIAAAMVIAIGTVATDEDMGTAIAVDAIGTIEAIAAGAGSGVIAITTEDSAVATAFATTTMMVIFGVEATEAIPKAMAITSGAAATETADTTGAAVASTGAAVGTTDTTATGAITGAVEGTTVMVGTTGVVEDITTAEVTTMAEVTTTVEDITAVAGITVTDGRLASVNLLRDPAS
jgi:hypothetical protein